MAAATARQRQLTSPEVEFRIADLLGYLSIDQLVLG
jgi:hypothetical protein